LVAAARRLGALVDPALRAYAEILKDRKHPQRPAVARDVLDRRLFKTEVIRRKGPWRHLEAVEFATLDWVDWFNHRRLLEPIGDMPPAEYEARYYEQAPWPDSH
jgi:transposase InsO family protein